MRWPLVVIGYRRQVEHAILDAWLRAVLKPVRGVG